MYPDCLHHFLLPSLSPAIDLAVVGTAWVTEETETSLDVEWENPLTEVDYYKLRYGPLTGKEVDEVTVPKSSDPKSRYDITGKNQHWEREVFAVDAEVETMCTGYPVL
jgi:syndecan 4